MTRSLRTILFLTVLLAATSSSALARMVIGITPAIMPGAANRAVLTTLEEELTSRLGEAVQVRSFETEATTLDWLIRFRELDAALISRSLLNTLPAGTLAHLADLPAAVAVTCPGLDAARHEKLRQVFATLSGDERGRQLLSRLAATTKVAAAPKSALARTEAQTVPAPPKPAAVAPIVPPSATPAAIPALTPVKPAATLTQMVITPPLVPVAPPAKPPATSTTTLPPSKTPASRSHVTQTTAAKPQPAAPAPPTAPTGETSNPRRTRLLLLAALVVMIGIGIKITLLIRHWEQSKRGPAAPPEPPSAEVFDFQAADAQSLRAHGSQNRGTAPRQATAAVNLPDSTVTTEIPVATTEPVKQRRPAPKRKTAVKIAGERIPPTDDGPVVEQGRLGRIKVPALLKRCADLPQPVVLRVRTEENETCIHFAGGQICHAYSRDWRLAEGARQWSKLGYLMIREGLISEAQRDQALELIERQEGLRLAAALQQLGILDLEALRHILARQAKTTLFALILFSSGEYRIEADSGAIPAEESIALRVDTLIHEASQHQAEWTAIRKILPTLGTLLDFAPDGRGKVDQVRLSVHQQLLLSQVDGQISVGTLCSSSTMMDYEVCRFLYMMIKAGVLQVVPAV